MLWGLPGGVPFPDEETVMCSVLLLVEIEENRFPFLLLIDGQPRFEGVFSDQDSFRLLTDRLRAQGLETAYVRLRAQSAAAISQALLLALFFDGRDWTVGLDAPLSPPGEKARLGQGRQRPLAGENRAAAPPALLPAN